MAETKGILAGTDEQLRKAVKKLADRTMGAGMRPADAEAGKELLALVTEAERAGDRRVIQALATKELRDILLFAAEGGHVEFVKALLTAGVKPDLTLMAGLRPINSAAMAGRWEVIEVLVRAGEDPSYAGFFDTPVVIQAAEKGHLGTVATLVRIGANVKARTAFGRTLMTTVAAKTDVGLIRLIVQHGGDVNEAEDEGRTPLMLAAEAGNLEAVQELIRLGAKVNTASRLRSIEQIEAEGRGEGVFSSKTLRRIRAIRKDPQETALMLAAEGGHTEVVEALLKAGADTKARDADGQTALDRANANGYAKIAHLLRGGEAAGAPTVGVSDLLQAAREGNLEVVRAAIRARVDLNAKDKVAYRQLEPGKPETEVTGGKPALVLAAERGDVAMAKELLAAGANPNVCAHQTLFDNGQNALHVAAGNGNVELVKILLSAGANVNAKEIGRKDIPARTALQIATENKRRAVVEVLLAADGKGKTKPPAGLYEAAENGDLALVRRLLAAGAGVNALAKGTRWSPLMMACFMAHPRVAAVLLDAGADVNATNRMGQTALSVAVHGAWVRSDWDAKKKRSAETLATIRLLLKRGANVNVDTWDGETPLEMARGSGLRSIAALLKQAGGKRAAQLGTRTPERASRPRRQRSRESQKHVKKAASRRKRPSARTRRTRRR